MVNAALVPDAESELTASLAGYALFKHSPPDTVAFVLAFAAGAILTMLADTMMPEAYEHGGKLVGVITTLGFAVAFAIHTLDCAAFDEAGIRRPFHTSGVT